MIKLSKLPELEFPRVYQQPADFNETRTSEGLFSWLSKNQAEIMRECQKAGAILFRGFPVSSSQIFQEFSSIFIPNLASYVGGDSPRTKVSGAVYTSTEVPANLTISMHNEMSYSNSYPSTVLFHCDIAPQKRGETPLADCRRLYRSLPKELVERFEKKKVTYIQNLHDGLGLGKSWQQTFETKNKADVEAILDRRRAKYEWKEEGGLRISETVDQVIIHPATGEKCFFTQAHQWHYSELDKETQESLLGMMEESDFYHTCTFGDGTPMDLNDLEMIRAAFKKESVEFSWQKGDVCLVDNILVAHGRNSFEGPRRILVAFG